MLHLAACLHKTLSLRPCDGVPGITLKLLTPRLLRQRSGLGDDGFSSQGTLRACVQTGVPSDSSGVVGLGVLTPCLQVSFVVLVRIIDDRFDLVYSLTVRPLPPAQMM